MYIKVIGGLFVLVSSAAIGFLKAEELHQRVKLLEELKRVIVLLKGELRFHRAELSEAFEHVAEKTSVPFEGFLKNTAKQMEMRAEGGFEKIWSDNCLSLLRTEGFRKEDRELFEVLGTGLGYLDLTMQKENLNLVLQQIEEKIGCAKEVQKSKGKVYQTMGVTVGTLLALMMI